MREFFARNGDTITTIFGLMAAAVIVSGIKFDALIVGDPVSLRLAGGAALAAFFGWLALKGKKDS